jgi:hypothetical protein
MAVDAAPSGKAPPGRLRFGAATRALATAFAVAAPRAARRQQCGARRDRPAQRARERVVSSTPAAARRRAVPRPEDGRGLDARTAGGRRLGRVPVPGDRSGPDHDGVPDRNPIRTGERCHRALRRRVRSASGGAAVVREQDAKTRGLGWQCFGGTGAAGVEVEGGARRGWTPGRAW